MTDFKPKQGEMILVAGGDGAWMASPRQFIALHKGGYLCESSVLNDFYVWQQAKPLPTEPEPVPYTHETWPKQVVWVRKQTWGKGQADMVIGLYDIGTNTEDRCTDFDELARDWEMSLDFCQTWQPCHYVPESEE